MRLRSGPGFTCSRRRVMGGGLAAAPAERSGFPPIRAGARADLPNAINPERPRLARCRAQRNGLNAAVS
jgi:hypothetical protein